jgi:hypothetical protein
MNELSLCEGSATRRSVSTRRRSPSVAEAAEAAAAILAVRFVSVSLARAMAGKVAIKTGDMVSARRGARR